MLPSAEKSDCDIPAGSHGHGREESRPSKKPLKSEQDARFYFSPSWCNLLPSAEKPDRDIPAGSRRHGREESRPSKKPLKSEQDARFYFSPSWCNLLPSAELSEAHLGGWSGLDKGVNVQQIVLHMKTATVRDLRNHYTSLLRWIAAGEEVLITQKGLPVARLVPPEPVTTTRVNWEESPEVKRDRSIETQLSAAESASLIAEASGQW